MIEQITRLTMTPRQLVWCRVPRAGIKGGIGEDDIYVDDDDEASLEGASDDEASLEGASDDEASLEGAVCHLSVLVFQGMSKRQAAIQTDTRSLSLTAGSRYRRFPV